MNRRHTRGVVERRVYRKSGTMLKRPLAVQSTPMEMRAGIGHVGCVVTEGWRGGEGGGELIQR